MLPGSRRAGTIVRVLFGLLGFGLGLAGVWHAIASFEGGIHLRLAAAAMSAAIAAFFVLNVALHRPVAWPWKLFAASLAALSVGRILFGP